MERIAEGEEVERAAEVTYRRASETDLPRVSAVFRAALDAYRVPAGQAAIPAGDSQLAGYLHFLRHDGERFWVAEAIVEELAGGGTGSLGVGGRQIVAWGHGLLRGDWWFLSSLFVLPEAQGRGIGGRLFELAMSGVPSGAVRATVTDSIQPISNTLYARRGLLPREVTVGFGGRPREGLRLPRIGTLDCEPLTVASIPKLREVDAVTTGLDRSVDYEFYLTIGGRHGWLFSRRGRPVAYVFHRKDGWIGPIAALRARDMRKVTAFGIADMALHGAAEKVSAGVIARCEGAQRAFWEAGLVFEDTPGLLLASRQFGRLDRYVPASYGMF